MAWKSVDQAQVHCSVGSTTQLRARCFLVEIVHLPELRFRRSVAYLFLSATLLSRSATPKNWTHSTQAAYQSRRLWRFPNALELRLTPEVEHRSFRFQFRQAHLGKSWFQSLPSARIASVLAANQA